MDDPDAITFPRNTARTVSDPVQRAGAGAKAPISATAEPTDCRSPGNLLLSGGSSVALITEMVEKLQMKAGPFASPFQPLPNTSAGAVLGIKVAWF